VAQHYHLNLSQDLSFEKGWLTRLTPFLYTRYGLYGKSQDIPGSDGILKMIRTGVRANFIEGFSLSLSWAVAMLRENQPEAEPEEIFPRQLEVSLGYSKTLELWPWPLHVDTTLRFSDARNTFNRGHQPFGNRDSLSGDISLRWEVGEDRELFATLAIAQEKPETTGDEATVDIFYKFGMRMGWDTEWNIARSGRVLGSVFEDLNANGKRDPEETGRAGVRIFVLDGPSTATNKDGRYSLKLKEGPVRLQLDRTQIPEGYFFTTSSTQQIFVEPGKKLTVDFGISTEVEFRGRIYNDVNENLIFDETVDEPLRKVKVRLDSGQSAYSRHGGYYVLRRVPPGTYILSLDIPSLPDGYQTLVSVRKKWELEQGEVAEYDIPLKAQRSVIGTVFEDLNGDGNWESMSESGMAGIGVWLGDQGAVTDEKGQFRFRNLEPGTVTVRLDLDSIPAGYQLSTAAEFQIEIPAEPHRRDHIDFGLAPPEKQKTFEEHANERFWDKVRNHFRRPSRVLNEQFYD